MEKKSAHNVKI